MRFGAMMFSVLTTLCFVEVLPSNLAERSVEVTVRDIVPRSSSGHNRRTPRIPSPPVNYSPTRVIRQAGMQDLDKIIMAIVRFIEKCLQALQRSPQAVASLAKASDVLAKGAKLAQTVAKTGIAGASKASEAVKKVGDVGLSKTATNAVRNLKSSANSAKVAVLDKVHGVVDKGKAAYEQLKPQIDQAKAIYEKVSPYVKAAKEGVKIGKAVHAEYSKREETEKHQGAPTPQDAPKEPLVKVSETVSAHEVGKTPKEDHSEIAEEVHLIRKASMIDEKNIIVNIPRNDLVEIPRNDFIMMSKRSLKVLPPNEGIAQEKRKNEENTSAAVDSAAAPPVDQRIGRSVPTEESNALRAVLFGAATITGTLAAFLLCCIEKGKDGREKTGMNKNVAETVSLV